MCRDRTSCAAQVRVVRRFWIVQKWDLDGYRVARVTFFSDDDPAPAPAPAPALAPAPAPAQAGAAVDSAPPEDRDKALPGPSATGRDEGQSSVTSGAPSSASNRQPDTDTAAAASGPEGSGAKPTRKSASATTQCDGAGASGPSSHESGPERQQQQAGDAKPISNSQAAPALAGRAAAASTGAATVVYSAQLRQMARNVQITVKEWLVRHLVALIRLLGPVLIFIERLATPPLTQPNECSGTCLTQHVMYVTFTCCRCGRNL